MKTFTLFAVLIILSQALLAQDCFSEGMEKELILGSLMPYTKVKVGEAEGYFLLDFGTTASTIDPNGFINGRPEPLPNTVNRFDGFDFYGSWGTVTLSVQQHANIQGIKQAGILGTDFLSLHTFALNYQTNKLYRYDQQDFCQDGDLLKNGFKAASTAGYFSNDINKLNNACTPNIPTIPIKIGAVQAVAQIDPGYDDRIYRHSININQAYYDALISANIELVPNPDANFTLSTSQAGINESVIAFTLPKGTTFSVVATDGTSILIHSDVNIFLKQTPMEAKKCGGIGTWQIPAAQIGASFLLDAEIVVFDPYRSKVWFKTR